MEVAEANGVQKSSTSMSENSSEVKSNLKMFLVNISVVTVFNKFGKKNIGNL